MSNLANGFVGITKGRFGEIVYSTARRTVAEVWDAIFYGIEQANAQYSREKAPQMLDRKWQVVGVTLTFPPNYEVNSEGTHVTHN